MNFAGVALRACGGRKGGIPEMKSPGVEPDQGVAVVSPRVAILDTRPILDLVLPEANLGLGEAVVC